MERKKHKHKLPCTPRVNDKIMEYYIKFGKDRDLEKFMRLHSPAQSRGGSSSSCVSLSELSSMRRLFSLSSSASVPNMKMSDGSAEDVYVPKELVIPIIMEDPSESKKRETLTENWSEELKTPPKSEKDRKLTNTPDSNLKIDKRLEWDSLGDIGYKKSMSTSNISILERSLLKELFPESLPPASPQKHTTNISDGDLMGLQRGLSKEDRWEARSRGHNQNTPPLASSTLVDPKLSARGTGARPKARSQSTSTSLQKRSEKSAQTSARNFDANSKEVQVSIPSAPPSAMGSSVTPSSFEFFSSRSHTTATSSEGPGGKASRAHKKHSSAPKPQTTLVQNAYTQSSDRHERDSSRIAVLHQALEREEGENKENSAAYLSYAGSPELELGTQLLCSLIDSKNFSRKQKKKLVRAIIKRIALLGGISGCTTPAETDGSVRSGMSTRTYTLKTSIATSIKSQQNSCQAITHVANTEEVTDTTHTTTSIRRSPPDDAASPHESTGEQLMRITVYRKPSPAATNSEVSEESIPQLASAKEITSICTASNKVPKVAPRKSHKHDRADIDKAVQTTSSHEDAKTTKCRSAPKPAAEQKRCSPTANPPTASSASSSSREPTTRKAANEVKNSSTDAEQPTMSSWLNPMTQSEIDYEVKKRELMKNSYVRQGVLHREDDLTHTERREHINWIETEIIRLENLRHLLLKDDQITTDLEDHQPKKEHHEKQKKMPSPRLPTPRSENEEKIYDTVCSENSVQLSSSTKRLIQDLRLVIEHTSEDSACANGNTTDTRQSEPEPEIQAIYDKPSGESDYDYVPPGSARSCKDKESKTPAEQQVAPKPSKAKQSKAPAKPPPPQQQQHSHDVPAQRCKIDTPPGSAGSESVCSFVQHRKREFAEHYKNKKKTHFETLKHQELHEKEALLEQLQQQQQLYLQRQQQSQTYPPQTTCSHYTVPHATQILHPLHYCNYNCFQHCYQHHHLPPRASPPPPPPPPAPPHATPQPKSTSSGALGTSTGTEHPNQTSSSSMFCISSEVSIPMGYNTNSSSPTTTTHQYDVAATTGAGVGVQTGDSLLRSQPIFGPQHHQNHPKDAASNLVPYRANSGKTVCVQVKPKSLAYVVEFAARECDGNTSSVSTHDNANLTQKKPTPTLQDYLQSAKPVFCAKSKERKAILNQMQVLRQERSREMRDIVNNTSWKSMDRKLGYLPPPPTQNLRVFHTKEMKALTSKRFTKLPEVLEKRQREREERVRRGNRILRDVFNQRMQKRVRSGQLSLNHSKTVI